MKLLQVHEIRISAKHGEGELRCHLGEVAEHANWIERWALAFVFRLIDRLYQATYLLAEEKSKTH